MIFYCQRRNAFIQAASALFLMASLITTLPANSQEARQNDAGPRSAARSQARDIISDNLEQVAATTTQILEILNREPGLFIELKRLLAQDAGMAGQLLQESDLSDPAVADRLKGDLRARVLATNLLQRYGYLVPRLNPDSELGSEQRLVQQRRAEAITRTAEREDSSVSGLPTKGNTSCDSPTLPNCRTQEPASSSPAVRSPAALAPFQQYTEYPQGDLDHPEDNNIRSEPPKKSERIGPTPQTVRASMHNDWDPSVIDSRRPSPTPISSRPSSGSMELESSSMSDFRMETAMDAAPLAARNLGAPWPPVGPPSTGSIPPDPVRMTRKPYPYASTPALYDLYVQAASDKRPVERFGVDVFRRNDVNQASLPMDLPAGPSYVVGPGDSLSINMWGGVSQRLFRTVDREGRLSLPEVGPLLVSGRALGDVQQEVQRVMRTQFRDVSVDVSLQRLRTVHVYVVGDVANPGAYDLSALSTPLNALFTAGGVTARGSLRRLQHRRGKQLVQEVDGYDLLLHGVREDLVRLENGDSLLVPPLGPVITLEGMVRRPAQYELRDEETLEDALALAGGILPAAALQHIEVQRLVAHEKRTMLTAEVGETSDLEAVGKQLRAYSVQDGDEIHIFPIAPYNSAAVYLEGHVLRPGRYSFKPGMTLTDLVGSYNDLLPEPSVRYAEIVRIQAPDYHPVVEAFDLATALARPETAPKLAALDTVRVFGRYDFEAAPDVLITGEVRLPGRYRTSGQQHLRDAVYQAGGLTPDAQLDTAQLFRRRPDGTSGVFSINLADALAGDPLNNVLLEPSDRILIHRQPERVSPASVYIRGEVARPGRYPLTVNMHVDDLVRSAGGFLRSANSESGDLVHYGESGETRSPSASPLHVTVNLESLNADNPANVTLRDGDLLTVPQRAGWQDRGAVVTLRGEVAKPGEYGIQPGERLSSLLRRAGGLLPSASTRAAVFERNEVRELQKKSRDDLIQRLEQESTLVKTSVSSSGTEDAALQQSAMQQRARVLDGLRKAPISGRLVIHLRVDRKGFAGSADDIELRAGDSLTIPKQPGEVVVVGQVYNANALTYTPGRNAQWYLSRAGGATQLANRGAIFVIRADGSVTSGRQGALWSGNTLSAEIGPGDTIVVPEKAVGNGNTWKNIAAIAQIAQAGALAAAVAIP